VTEKLRPRSDLAALEGYHSPQLDVEVRLNTNESPYAPPPEFVEAWLGELARIPLHRYPDRGASALRAALAQQVGQSQERVFCANGSNEVLQTLLLTFGGAGRSAVVFEPTYALHAHIARITGTAVAVGARKRDFAVDLDGAVSLVTGLRPAVVFLCSPNNPTGTIEPRETVETLLDVAPGLVVVDEAYGEFADRSTLELVDDERQLVVVRTYSKVWSLAALRLGFCVAPAPIVTELEKVVLPYHLPAPSQLAGTAALRFGDEMDERVATLVKAREGLRQELSGIDGITVYPSGANFLLLQVHGDGHRVWLAMVERGVLVRDFSSWPRLEGCLRVTVGTPEENEKFLHALRAALTEVAEA
jgi:histidinol-phosphate aminotransferase